MFQVKNFIIALLFLVSIHVSHAAQFFIPNGDVTALRAAIVTSNTNNAPDTIHLAPFGVYWLNIVDNTFVHGSTGLPVVKKDGSDINYLTILGNGSTLIRDPSLASLRLLYFLDCKVNMYNVSLKNGKAEGSHPGGAIMVNGARINIFNSLLQGNVANQGGAVYVAASSEFSAVDCTFTNNTAVLGSGSALVNYSGLVFFKRCVVVNNNCLNTSGPAALFNYTPLNSPSTANIYLEKTIVALNKYVNAASPNNGKEFNLDGGAYTMGGNFIGSYPVVTQGINPKTFSHGSPNSSNDYVGTEAAPIDPLLNELGKYGFFTNSYSLKAGSLGLNNGAGTSAAATLPPMIASNGLVPQSAYIGDAFTILGSNLKNIIKVQFQGISITTGFTTTDTTIVMNIPVGARSGKILIWNALNNLALSDQEFTLRTIVTPPVPINVTATSTSSSSIRLQWQDGIEETGYQVEFKAAGDVTYTTAVTAADVTTYNIDNLICNKEYTLRVMALGRGTPSTYSSEVKVTTLSLMAPSLTASSALACVGNSIEVMAPVGFAEYLWSTGETTQTIHVSATGHYSVKVTDNDGCESSASEVPITFYEYPDTSVSVSSDGIIVSQASGADQYQWYHNDVAIPAQTENTLTVTETGIYKVGITSHGCTSFSRDIPFTITGLESNITSAIDVFPVPASDVITVSFNNEFAQVEGVISLIDLTGKVLIKQNKIGHKQSLSIEATSLPSGIYILQLQSRDGTTHRKILFKQ